MALISLGVLIVFTFSGFELDRLDFIANESGPIHPASIHWILLWGNAGVLSQVATKAKNSSRV